MAQVPEKYRLSLYMPRELHEKLWAASDVLDISLSEIARVALSEWYEKHFPGDKLFIESWAVWRDLWGERLASLVDEMQQHALALAEAGEIRTGSEDGE